MPEPSRPTLGLLREILEGLTPQDAMDANEIRKFWKDTLYDFGLSDEFIWAAGDLNFQWGEIIRALSRREFGERFRHLHGGVKIKSSFSAEHCEEGIKRLFQLALLATKDTPGGQELRDRLASDGIDFDQTVDSTIPTELANLPNEPTSEADIQTALNEGRLIAVIYLDLDGFKAVNDTLGHAVGNEYLIRVAKEMSAAVVGKGKLYRLHGDEFLIVLPNFDLSEAVATAERVRSAVDSGNAPDQPRVTLSVGVVSSASPGSTDAKVLMDRADKMMYEAKKAKNRVVVEKTE